MSYYIFLLNPTNTIENLLFFFFKKAPQQIILYDFFHLNFFHPIHFLEFFK
jgi:hypothetical protein